MPDTFTSLHFHLVFSTKDRQRWIGDPGRMHEYLGGCLRRLGAVPLSVGGVEDHVHALVRLKPTHRLADVLRDVKRPSSIWMSETIPGFRWQDGYAAFSVSESLLDRVRRYVDTQAGHHRRRTFEEELRDMLVKNRVEFDERFLL